MRRPYGMPMRLRIKICGITREEDARAAVEAGADAVGFVFAESPRRIDPAAARRIRETLPPFVAAVGVFVDEAPEVVLAIAADAGLSGVQLHGDEPAAAAAALAPIPVLKAIRVRGPESLAAFDGYPAAGFLLDTEHPGKRGGTGVPWSWSVLARAQSSRPIVLAGGLRPENVAEGIRAARAAGLPLWGVDVSSSVESRPGVKDPARIRAFVRAARSAAGEEA